MRLFTYQYRRPASSFNTRVSLPILFGIVLLVSLFSSMVNAEGRQFNLGPDQHRIRAQKDPSAVALIPRNFKFVTPGYLTVGVTAENSPPLDLLATDNRTPIGSEADTAQLVADALGLKLKLVVTSWDDWPLGVSSGRFDIAMTNITVTQSRKKLFDFATERNDVLGFYVRKNSPIKSIREARDIAGLKIIVGSGTNQEQVLLAWNKLNQKAGLKPAQLLYYNDNAAASLAVQSGRVDATFGPNATGAYQAAATGRTRLVGLVSGGWPNTFANIAITTKKGNGLVNALAAAVNSVIKNGEYTRVLKRWGLESEAIQHSDINPQGLPQ